MKKMEVFKICLNFVRMAFDVFVIFYILRSFRKSEE